MIAYLEALRDDVARLRDEVDALFQPMQDAERAYWVADSAWREKAWELFAAENPDLEKLALEAKTHEQALVDIKRKVTETAKERGASLPSGFWS